MSDIKAFPHLVGKDDVLSRISAFTKSGHTPHAVLFCGEVGVGKHTTAVYFSAVLLCENKNDGQPCGHCGCCTKIMNGSHPDVDVLRPEGGANSFHIDKIRKLRKDAYIKPNESDFKIFILCDADKMTVSAQNALLKILEEPPGFTHFILTTDCPGSLLDTIISRVVTLDIPTADVGDCISFLGDTHGDIDSKKITEICSVCRGNIGKSLDLLTDDNSYQRYLDTLGMLQCIASGNFYGFAGEISKFERDRASFKSAVKLLLDITVLIFEEKIAQNSNNYLSVDLSQIYHLTNRQFSAIIDMLDSIISDIDRNVSVAVLSACLSFEIMRILT